MAAERARASRQLATVEQLRERIDASHRRFVAEHRQSNSLRRLLRHYLVRLRRTEAELARRVIAERRLKLDQLGTAIKIARRRGVLPPAADRAARLLSVSPDYAAAVARWRAGEVPADIRRMRLGHLDWWVPPLTSDALGRQILDRRQLALDSLLATRQFAVGGVMLDIGAGIGAACIPRVALGEFGQAFAAEPGGDNYLCLVGNTLENVLEGCVLPHRVAISGVAGTDRARWCGGIDAEDVPALTLDDWVRQLDAPPYDVRFVRVALRDWNINVLDGAPNLLKLRHIVWQIEIDSTTLKSGTAPLDGFCRRVETHFTHIKELGRYWIPQWRPSSQIGVVLSEVRETRRPLNLLLFNMRRDIARTSKALSHSDN